MVNLWWTLPETENFESYEMEVIIDGEIDPSKINLYIAPIGLGQLNGAKFYGGLQTNTGGFPAADPSPEYVPGNSKAAIFSRWGDKGIDRSYVRTAVDGFFEAADYEGDFASGRRPYEWTNGHYIFSLRKMDFERDSEGKEWTWVGAYATDVSTGISTFISALKFPGKTLTLGSAHSSFIEIYGGKEVVIADLPKLQVQIGAPRINGKRLPMNELRVIFPKAGQTASPAIMTAELSEDKQYVVCTLHNEILQRKEWKYPLPQE
ncbi:MAG: hypothetical protein NWR03_14220 [Akkermansiaceae bacterium]|nr:hypothetical protein [Akkermansiaceae bacterium]